MTKTLVDDPVGRELADALAPQYEVLGLLGRGGMGAVYLAREPLLDRMVAVKVLSTDVAPADARERFVREARTAARLSHPHIVPLYTFGQAGLLFYYVMGYVDGESLGARLRREGRLPFEDTRRIVAELADALDYAHQQGVVHRDVKPDNVLLDRHTSRALLTDFGIARPAATDGTLTAPGVIVGTPHYMSPEQASGDRALDGRSDIYALGVLAYRMLAGRLPFDGEGMREVMAQHVARAPVPIGELLPAIPAELSHVVMRALSKAPAERWPTGAAMRNALASDGEESMPEPLERISGMGVRMLALAAGTTEAAALAGIFGFGWRAATLFGIMGVLALAGAAAGMLPAARRFGLRATLHAWLLQPRWWRSWWPRIGRRAGDVWDRLPGIVRWYRFCNTLEGTVLVSLPLWDILFAIARGVARSPDPAAGLRVIPWMVGIGGVCFAGAIGGYWHYGAWARRVGLSKRDAARLMREPGAGASFWWQPHIQALLGAPAPAAASATGRSPVELLQGIVALARDAGSAPHRDLLDAAVPAARALVAAIAACDDEARQLARDADEEEHSRVESRLAVLGSAPPDERAPQARMRTLLEEQLALYRELRQRRLDVEARREQLLEQLRTLALQLARLRAVVAESNEAAEITAHVRSLVRGVGYRIAGIREADRVVE